MSKYNYISPEERAKIEELLNANYIISEISTELNRNRSTISNEVKKHTVEIQNRNCDCAIASICTEKSLCEFCKMPDLECRVCVIADAKCKARVPPTCRLRQRNQLCNGCKYLRNCKLTKYLYRKD